MDSVCISLRLREHSVMEGKFAVYHYVFINIVPKRYSVNLFRGILAISPENLKRPCRESEELNGNL